MSKYKIKFKKKKDMENLYSRIDDHLNIIKVKKKSLIVKEKDLQHLRYKVINAISDYNIHTNYSSAPIEYDISTEK